MDPAGSSGSCEIVEYAEGDMGIHPPPAWVWGDELLTDVGRAVCRDGRLVALNGRDLGDAASRRIRLPAPQ
jgi:hypothetical protein